MKRLRIAATPPLVTLAWCNPVQGGLAEALAGAFSGMDDPFAGKQPAATVTAQWMKFYIVRAPGIPDRTVRRPIFDLIGPAARDAGRVPMQTLSAAEALTWRLALLGGTEFLLLGGDLSPEYVASVTAGGLIANRQAALESVRQQRQPTGTRRIPNVKRLPAGELYALALVRRNSRTLNGEVYLSQPNVLSYHRQLRLDVQGELRPIESFDIVANEVAVIPGSRSPIELRLRQGVLDTNAEALLGALRCQQASRDAQCGTTANAAEQFHQALGKGRQWRLVRDASALSDLRWPETALGQARQHLAAGYQLLVPDHPGSESASWWRIDPRTGNVLGFGERGWGSDTIEFIFTESVILNMGATFWCFSSAAGDHSDRRTGRFDLCMIGFGAGITQNALVAFQIGSPWLRLQLLIMQMVLQGVSGLGVSYW